jgi:hypothetical protein
VLRCFISGCFPLSMSQRKLKALFLGGLAITSALLSVT